MNRTRALLIGGGITLAVLVAPAIKVHNYINHDPRFCTSCHLMDEPYLKWQDSSHKEIDCHACHLSDTQGDLLRLYYSVFDPKSEISNHAYIDRGICLKCHESEGGERWRSILATAGHEVHADGDEPTQCMECHTEEVHLFEASPDVCVRCHDNVQVHEGMGKGLECLSCHGFLAERKRNGLRPEASDCRRCHGADSQDEALLAKVGATSTTAKVIDPASIHGGVDCRRCHNPHAKDETKHHAGRFCANCHRNPISTQIAMAREGHSKCEGCHIAHDEHGAAAGRCRDCHERHTALVDTLHEGKCETCHEPHTFKASGRDCVACHAENATRMFAAAPSEHDPCTNCHVPHGSPASGRTCARCHNEKANELRTGPSSHRDCTGCHAPHEGKPDRKRSCDRCHEDKVDLVANAGEAKHQECVSCHEALHGDLGTDGRACASCHKDQGRSVHKGKNAPEHKRCGSCHEPHGGTIAAQTSKCAACHEGKAGGPSDPHAAKCATCHVPHGAPLVTINNCTAAGCHDKVQTKPGKGKKDHANCKSCHAPHEALVSEGRSCLKCHEEKKTALVSAQEGHVRCTSCHEGHDAAHPKDCASCHEAQGEAALGGKHKDCFGCHQPHEKAQRWDSCQRCHANMVDAVKHRGPEHQRCQGCHPSHKFPRPTCESCHQEIRAELMHQVDTHSEKCSDCHETHAGGEVTRATCLGCHTAEKRHYVETPKCQTCHPFRPERTGG